MKIIHCADLHLDSKMESNLDRDAAGLRREELLETFETMVSYAVKNEVKVIIIAGDMFDKPNVRKSAKNRVLDQMREHPEIEFCYLKGNHDKCNFVDELTEQENLTNVKLFGDEGWTSYDFGEVVVSGMELTKDNSQTLGMNLVLDQERFNIVVLHGQESDYQGNDKTEIVNLSLLRNKYIDYLALGHIHEYKEDRLDDRGRYCYSGCLEGRGFDECGEKGFVVLNVEDGRLSTEFISIAKRQLHDIKVEIDPEMKFSDMVEKTNEAVAEISEDDLIKITYVGKVKMNGEVSTTRLKKKLNKDFFFVKMYDKTSLVIDYEKFKNDKSLKGEFVRLLETEDMSEERRGAIIEIGMKAILGEDLEE
ncbi:MAG: metallophosphoesterase family protein [Lachnospiraceae bacterium]|nr:metallophosphoesterase family protein [Lachnospiraceae bacterium]